jgi:hypothetical protein
MSQKYSLIKLSYLDPLVLTADTKLSSHFSLERLRSLRKTCFMKNSLTTLVMILFVSLLTATPSWSERTSVDDLVERDGLFYKKFTDALFTGEIDEGSAQGSLKNGKPEGPWVIYHDNGQLQGKGDIKNLEREGPWVFYSEDGTVDNALTGTYKNGEKISD